MKRIKLWISKRGGRPMNRGIWRSSVYSWMLKRLPRVKGGFVVHPVTSRVLSCYGLILAIWDAIRPGGVSADDSRWWGHAYVRDSRGKWKAAA